MRLLKLIPKKILKKSLKKKNKLKEHNFKFLESLVLQTGKRVSGKSWGCLVVAKRL